MHPSLKEDVNEDSGFMHSSPWKDFNEDSDRMHSSSQEDFNEVSDCMHSPLYDVDWFSELQLHSGCSPDVIPCG